MSLRGRGLLGVSLKYLFVEVPKAWKEIAKDTTSCFLIMITVLDGICESMRCSNYLFFVNLFNEKLVMSKAAMIASL